MAKCELTVELDEPDRVYRGGDTVTGRVMVRADQQVKCNGLVIKCMWETHGKGNVARGTHQEAVAFQGTWAAGTLEQYPFELQCGNWPPTYHGFHLNVDHYIQATADIPWAFDPKTKTPFQLVPRPDGATKVKASDGKQVSGPVGNIVSIIVVAIFCLVGVMFLFHPCAWVVGIGAACWWFVTKYLPKQKLGEVELNALTPAVSRGETFQAEIAFTPRANVSVNAINWTIRAHEEVVHGHGTSSKTYKHDSFVDVQTIERDSRLKANQPHRFTVTVPIESDAPLSLDLDHNKLKWTVQAHIDIPRWPDWKKKIDFQVVPVGSSKASDDVIPIAEPVRQQSNVTFGDTMEMISKVRTDIEQLERVINAVSGSDMNMTLSVERPISLSSLEPGVGYADGMAFEGASEAHGFPLQIYVPDSRREEFEGHLGTTWKGWGQIVGYDSRTGSLQIKVT